MKGGIYNLNEKEQEKHIIKLMEEGCKDYLVEAKRVVEEEGEPDYRKPCTLQIFIDKDGVVVFGRRVR